MQRLHLSAILPSSPSVARPSFFGRQTMIFYTLGSMFPDKIDKPQRTHLFALPSPPTRLHLYLHLNTSIICPPNTPI
ncbi:hypothetical protein BDV97DRAFT_148577 [Delphinella strobiligena]|nr:hypothetical protein BDV97DRAFT_148577 [Delphinella strobiligena]